MLSPDYLEQAGEYITSVYRQIEAEMLDHLVAKMIEGGIDGQRSQTALLLLAQSSRTELIGILEENSKEIASTVREEVTDALRRSDADDLARIKKGMGVELQTITTAQIATTVAGLEQILARENLKMTQGAIDAFVREVSWAVTQVNVGAMTAEKALHGAVRRLEREGISTITYRNAKTGIETVRNKVDVAVRRHIRTQLAQDGMRLTEQRLDEAGVDLVEVSSHGGARPSHAKWEGKIYSRHGDKRVNGVLYKDFKTACKWGDVADGIGGANCLHSYAAWFPGMRRMYEPDPPHPSGKTNAEVYELTQKQRYLEREIRADKRELRGMQQLYEARGGVENLTELNKAKQNLKNRQAVMRKLIADNPKVLQRAPYREWAGDMPKLRSDVSIGRSLSAAAFRDPVQLPDGSLSRLTEGTRITGARVIAGAGVKRKIDCIDTLIDKFGGKRERWTKQRGTGYVDDLGMSRPCELHWYEEESVGRVKMKVKRYYY